MLIQEKDRRDYPSISPDYDEVTVQMIADAWVQFAAAGVQGDREGRGQKAASYADEMVEEFKKRFINSNK